MKWLSALAAVAVAAVLAVPGTAQAHGALTNPVSRLAACGTEGTSAGTAACAAALAESGRQRWADWDNLRLPGVGGRDREVIPDGKLCSAGIDRYAGLDLPRADWPATRLTAGAGYFAPLAAKPDAKPDAKPPARPAVAPVKVARPEPVSSTSALPLIGGGAALIVVLGALFAVVLHRKRR